MTNHHVNGRPCLETAGVKPAGAGLYSRFVKFCQKWAPQLLVIVGTAPVNFALVIPRPVLKAMSIAIGNGAASGLLTKMIIAVIGLSVVAGAPIAGALISRFGQRVSLITAIALFVAFGAMPFVLNNLVAIIASRAVLGFSVAAIQVSAVSLAGELHAEEKRAKVLGFMMATASFAALLLGPASGLLGEFGWRVPFLLYLAGIPFLIMAIIGLPRLVVPVRRGPPSARVSSLSTFPYLLAGVGLASGAIMTLPPVYLPFKLAELGVTSPALIGISFVAISIPEMLCAALYGFLRLRFSSQMMLLGGYASGTAGLVVIALMHTYAGVLAGMVIMGPAIAFVYAGVMEQASMWGDDRSRVVGVIVSAIFLSLVIGTFAVEPIYRAFGAVGAMLALALLSGVMSVVSLIGMINRRAS